MLSQLYQLFFGGDVGRKFSVAKRLFQLYGPDLQKDCEVMAGLAEFSLLHQQLQQQMRVMAIGSSCSECAKRNGGGCCSLAFAAETDALQLLINMLAGVQVRILPDKGTECCYLGETGCIFWAKPMFCLNYNCSLIRCGNQPADLQLLEELTGKVLSCQQEIEKGLLGFLRMRPAIFEQTGGTGLTICQPILQD